MSDELEEQTSFAVLRPLIVSTLKDLKDQGKEQQGEINQLKTQYALLTQRVAIYAAGIATGVGLIIQLGSNYL